MTAQLANKVPLHLRVYIVQTSQRVTFLQESAESCRMDKVSRELLWRLCEIGWQAAVTKQCQDDFFVGGNSADW